MGFNNVRILLLGLFTGVISVAAIEKNATKPHVIREKNRRHPRQLRGRRELWWPQARVVGGKDAVKGNFPSFVELPNGCGGTLVHSDLILTAAHCVEGDQNGALLRTIPTVYIGGVRTEQGLLRRIVDMRVDPRYNPSTKSYDFALLLLGKPVTEIAPLALNSEPTYPMDGTALAVAGYGRTQSNSQGKSSILQHAMVNAKSDCSTSSYPSGVIKDYEMMCANAPDYSQDACQGDSGGPLIDMHNNLLVGVVSWGSGCASLNTPGVYARISAAYDWIERQKCEFSNDPSPQCICTKKNIQCEEIRVDIAYDSYPSETGFQLVRLSDGVVMLSSPIGSNAGSMLTTISTPVLVPPGSYRLEVTDEYRDGMCCGYGSGSVSVQTGMKTIQHNGIFQDKAELLFDIEDRNAADIDRTLQVPTASPTSAPPPRATLRVDISYDNYPEELSWELLDVTTGDSLYLSPSGTAMIPQERIMIDIPELLIGGEYHFVVADIARDGLCWYGFCGSMRLIRIANDGIEDILWSHGGDFGASLDVAVIL